jgi:hypothetical protein
MDAELIYSRGVKSLLFRHAPTPTCSGDLPGHDVYAAVPRHLDGYSGAHGARPGIEPEHTEIDRA